MKLSHIGAIIGAAFVVILILVALLAGIISNYDPYAQSFANILEMPSSQHPFGTDRLGRDTFSRVLHGLREDLKVGVIAVFFALIAGAVLGGVGAILSMFAGSVGKTINNCIMMYARFLSVGPGILILLVIVSLGIGATIPTAIGIAFILIPGFIRVIGGVVQSSKDMSALSIAGLILGIISTSMALAVMLLAILGFIGLGQQPPIPSLGGLINEARSFLRTAPHGFYYPGIALILTIISFYVLGECLNAAFLNVE